MNLKLSFLVFVLLVSLSFIFVGDRADSLDIKKMLRGIVKETKVDFIKVQDDLKGTDMRIAIDSNTVFDNVQKVSDLKIGDDVQIEYQTNHHMNTAITITKLEIES